MQIRSTNWKILTFTIVPFLQNSPDQYLLNSSILLFALPFFFIVVSDKEEIEVLFNSGKH